MATKPMTTRVSATPPAIEKMLTDFYTLLPWKEPPKPTADVSFEEINLLLRLFYEELGEYVTATEARDIEEVADAVGDITYVAYGAVRHFGINLKKAMRQVHRFKMAALQAQLPAHGEQRQLVIGVHKGEIEDLVLAWYRFQKWPRRGAASADVSVEETRFLVSWFAAGIKAFEAATEVEDLERITSSLGEITYGAYAAALLYGFNLRYVVWAVHQSNMTKRSRFGGHDLDDQLKKVKRGDRYRRPNIQRALAFGPYRENLPDRSRA